MVYDIKHEKTFRMWSGTASIYQKQTAYNIQGREIFIHRRTFVTYLHKAFKNHLKVTF